MLCEHSHIKCESLAEIRSIIAEIKNFFSKGLFFIGAPCRTMGGCGRRETAEQND